MATVTLDTHRIVKGLKDAGFTDTQAETVTDMIAETGRPIWPTSRPRPDSAALRTEIRADLSALEARFVKWPVPLMLGQAGLIVALIKLLS